MGMEWGWFTTPVPWPAFVDAANREGWIVLDPAQAEQVRIELAWLLDKTDQSDGFEPLRRALVRLAVFLNWTGSTEQARQGMEGE